MPKYLIEGKKKEKEYKFSLFNYRNIVFQLNKNTRTVSFHISQAAHSYSISNKQLKYHSFKLPVYQ